MVTNIPYTVVIVTASLVNFGGFVLSDFCTCIITKLDFQTCSLTWVKLEYMSVNFLFHSEKKN